MASSNGSPDSLVVLHFHDFRAERMQHWWDLLEGDDRASIKSVFGKFSSLMRLHVDCGLLEALASFWDPSHCCFSIGEMDLVPTLEEYAELLQLDSPFGETPFMPSPNPRIDVGVVPLVCGEDESIVPTVLCETVRSLSYCRRRGEVVPMFCVQLLQLWFYSHLQHFYLRQTPYYLTRHTMMQTVDTSLPFTGTGDEWALYLLDLPLSQWFWRVTWGPVVWKLWTHCSRFDGMPLLGMWGCTGYYPGLALRQFGDGLSADSFVTAEFVEWREGWNPSFILRPTIRPELATLHLARVSEREESAAHVESMRHTMHHSNAAMANLRRDLEAQRGNVSIYREMNNFIREQLEISEGAKDHLKQALADAQEQLETEALHEITRVVDSLGADARTVLEGYDEGDPILSTVLGEILHRRPAYVLVTSEC
uniref:DUF7745 domain-containing protein n=1 Tax=Fagus sylvatica TaxID=28930 RepID=A0A2N9FVU9_FAGSY